jgi:hypothetical protein
MNNLLILILTITLLLIIRIIFLKTNKDKKKIEGFENPGSTDKIAFCFLTIDNINKIDVWEDFFRGHEDKYSLYIHPKNPEKVDKKYKSNIIGNLIETKWGEISLVRATMNLFKAAFADPDNKLCVLVSDSCIPLNNFDYIYNELMINNDGDNIISLRNDTPQGYKIRHNSLKMKNPNFIKFINFKKSSQWCAINRKSIDFLLTYDYTDLFSLMFAPDEHYFINIFDKFNIPYKIMNITYDNWKEPSDDKEKYKAFPKIYTNINDTDIIKARQTGALFFRKVVKESKLDINYLLSNNIGSPNIKTMYH